jgi:hypothetical protein
MQNNFKTVSYATNQSRNETESYPKLCKSLSQLEKITTKTGLKNYRTFRYLLINKADQNKKKIIKKIKQILTIL